MGRLTYLAAKPVEVSTLPVRTAIPAGTETENANVLVTKINELRTQLPTQFVDASWAKNIVLTSSYRTSAEEDKLSNGVKKSNHTNGSAVDFQLGPGATPQDYLNVFNKLKEKSSEYTELYLETNGKSSWIHMAVKTKNTSQDSNPPAILNGDTNKAITEAQMLSGAVNSGKTAGVAPTGIEEGIPSSYVPLKSSYVDTQSAKDDRSLFIEEGLDTVAWYDDPNLLVGNPHKKVTMKTSSSSAEGYKELTPVSFTLNLREFSTPLYAGPDKPLTLKLNCSIDTFALSMKHIVNKSNTRTGFHMTFWGMEPDTITGSGSTGVFLNQWGVTDLMSMNATDELKQSASKERPRIETDDGPVSYVSTIGDNYFRIAAQDAFVELLALFRNNGITRYKKDNYTTGDSITINRDQVQQSVWSEKYGDSAYTRNARNNDVMVKGNVTMKFKSNSYHGYFKSLQWTMDADNPYQWKFDFTFQVQRTVSFVFYPKV